MINESSLMLDWLIIAVILNNLTVLTCSEALIKRKKEERWSWIILPVITAIFLSLVFLFFAVDIFTILLKEAGEFLLN